MKKIRVLYLISTNIDLRSINNSPRYSKYHFFTLDAMKYLEGFDTISSSKKLAKSLSDTIQRIKPLYLIVHLGLAFERYPIEFLNPVLDVKTTHKKLKLGLDRGLEYAIDRIQAIKYQTLDSENIIKKLRNDYLLFESDEETLHLASLLF